MPPTTQTKVPGDPDDALNPSKGSICLCDVPTYRDKVPLYSGPELSSRLNHLPFHLATLLHPSNIRNLIQELGTNRHWHNYISTTEHYRREMLAELLLDRGISQRTVDTFKSIDRQQFMPTNLTSICYLLEGYQAQEAIHTTCPFLLAFMLDHVPADAARIILGGVGSGYGLAVLQALFPESQVIAYETERAAFDRTVLANSSQKTRNKPPQIVLGSVWGHELTGTSTIVTTFGGDRKRCLRAANSYRASIMPIGSMPSILYADMEPVLTGVRFVEDQATLLGS